MPLCQQSVCRVWLTTYQCIGVTLNVVHRLIGQVFTLVEMISTVEYYLRFRRKSAQEG